MTIIFFSSLTLLESLTLLFSFAIIINDSISIALKTNNLKINALLYIKK